MTKFKATADAIAQQVGDELVLVNLRTNRMFAANETAARIWQVVTAGGDLESLQLELSRNEDSPENVSRDITELLAALESEGLIERS
jgi:hypothetical protein